MNYDCRDLALVTAFLCLLEWLHTLKRGDAKGEKEGMVWSCCFVSFRCWGRKRSTVQREGRYFKVKESYPAVDDIFLVWANIAPGPLRHPPSPLPKSSCHSKGLKKLKLYSYTAKSHDDPGITKRNLFPKHLLSFKDPKPTVEARESCSYVFISKFFEYYWVITKTTITSNLPPNHSRMLLHCSLQEAL